jgi:hypothetical protein
MNFECLVSESEVRDNPSTEYLYTGYHTLSRLPFMLEPLQVARLEH